MTQVYTLSETEGGGITSHPFYEALITLIRKPDKDLQENFRICLINVDPKLLFKETSKLNAARSNRDSIS